MAKKPAVPRSRPSLLAAVCLLATALAASLLVREAVADSAAAALPLLDAEDLLHQEACWRSPRAVRVEVVGVRSDRGAIVAKLFDDDPETFLKRDGGVDSAKVSASEGRTELCLIAPRAGHYAVALFHDENGDRRFNRNFLDIPEEGYGFSRNPGFLMRAPAYGEIAVELGEERTDLEVELLYLVE